MNILASYKPLNIQCRKNVYHTRISKIVKDSLKKNKRISIVLSQESAKPTVSNTILYACYDAQINNIYDELANEILSDIETCVYEYPDAYISIHTKEDNESIKIETKSKSYLIHCPE